MLPSDVAIWERFLERYGKDYTGFDYDVHVGGWVTETDQWTGTKKKVYWSMAAKRIDAVGHKPGEIWLLEVKPEAGVTAVGQLVMYSMLYRDRFHPVENVMAALVCENVLPDEKSVITRLGFKIFVV